MPNNASLTDDEKQRAWLEGCRSEEAISRLLERHGDKRCRSKQGWPVYRPIRRCFSIFAGQRSCRDLNFNKNFTGK